MVANSGNETEQGGTAIIFALQPLHKTVISQSNIWDGNPNDKLCILS